MVNAFLFQDGEVGRFDFTRQVTILYQDISLPLIDH